MNYLKNRKNSGGFIREIVLILVALVALRYFWDIDVIGYIEGPVEKGLDWIVGKFK